MTHNTILGIPIKNQTKLEILEEIKKYLGSHSRFCHIVSLNSENIAIATEEENFMEVIKTAQITIIDGVGVVLAARILKMAGNRVSGIDLMNNLIDLAEIMRLRVLLIGGRPNLANDIAQCYQIQYPEAKFKGIQGFADIKNPKEGEEKEICSIVRQYKPHLILAAFGSPWQELWLARHNKEFKNTVCMGVGQGFDIAGGIVKRAPIWVQKIGFEWLYRLITQPWRWRRQLRLIKFMWLVGKEKLSS